MSTRAAAWLAWTVLALCVALAVLAMGLDIYTPPTKYEPHFAVLAGIPLLVYPTIGALVVSHRPMNAVGWVLCAMGFVFEVLAFSRREGSGLADPLLHSMGGGPRPNIGCSAVGLAVPRWQAAAPRVVGSGIDGGLRDSANYLL